MFKHKTINTFHWMTWEVNTISKWNLESLCHIKKKNSSKNYLKNGAWKLVQGPFVFAKN